MKAKKPLIPAFNFYHRLNAISENAVSSNKLSRHWMSYSEADVDTISAYFLPSGRFKPKVDARKWVFDEDNQNFALRHIRPAIEDFDAKLKPELVDWLHDRISRNFGLWYTLRKRDFSARLHGILDQLVGNAIGDSVNHTYFSWGYGPRKEALGRFAEMNIRKIFIEASGETDMDRLRSTIQNEFIDGMDEAFEAAKRTHREGI